MTAYAFRLHPSAGKSCPVAWKDLGTPLLGRPQRRLCLICGAVKSPLRIIRKPVMA